MCSRKEKRTTAIYCWLSFYQLIIIFNSTIGAITNILYSLPLVPQLHSCCTSFLDFFIRYLFVRHAVTPPLRKYTVTNSKVQPISYEIDSCCYGSDCVKRNFCRVNFSGSDCVTKLNSCQLNFLDSDCVINVIPVN